MLLSRLVYDRKGSGDPLVLIHGIGHRRQGWYPMFDQLAERYDVIAVDLAGFGESARYPRTIPYNMENAVEDLVANFAEWGIEKPHLVGNSLGGAIALELAARGHASSATVLSPAGFFHHLERVRAISLLGLLLLGSRVAPRPLLRRLTSTPRGRGLIFGWLYARPGRHDARQMYGDALALAGSRAFFAVAKNGFRYSFELPVDVPTTVAWGTKDFILPFRQASVAKRILPHALHVPLEGAGHVPMIDAAHEIVELIDATIARARSRRAA